MKHVPSQRPRATHFEVSSWVAPYRTILPAGWESMVRVVMMRGYYLNSMGKKGVNDRAIYDDAAFVIGPSAFAAFNGNTDPAAYRPGMATAVAPQVIWYKPGYHGWNRASGHPAFRQASNVRVRRDGGVGNGKKLPDGSFVDSPSNRFWINLHRGGSFSTSSEGCLTIYKPQWDAFYQLVRDQLRANGQSEFPLLLIDAA